MRVQPTTNFQHPGVETAMITLNGQNLKKLFDMSGLASTAEPYTRSERQW